MMLARSLKVIPRRPWKYQAPIAIATIGAPLRTHQQLRCAASKANYQQFQTETVSTSHAFASDLRATQPPPPPLSPAVDSGAHTLSDLDRVYPNVLATSFLIYRLDPGQDIQHITESLRKGLRYAAEQIPPLGASIRFDSGGKPEKQMIPGELKLRVRSFEHWEHKSYDEIAATNFSPFEFEQGRLIPLEVYNNQEQRPVLMAQLSFIPDGLILGLGLNHIAGDGGARNLAITAICKATKAFMEARTPPALGLDYRKRAFSAPAELLGVPKEKLAARARDFRLVDAAAQDAAMNRLRAMSAQPNPTNKQQVYRITGDTARSLKYSCKPRNGAMFLSTYDCMTALLWRSLMRVRTQLRPELLDGDVDSRILHPVDLRQRSGPEVSKDYFGNAVTVVGAGLPMDELLGPDGLSLAASSIRVSIAKTTLASVADATALGTMTGPTERVVFSPADGILDRDFMLSTWHFMDTTTYDFGIGPPASIRPPAVLMPGFAFYFPDCEQKKNSRSYDLYFSLTAAEQEALSEDEEFSSCFRLVK